MFRPTHFVILFAVVLYANATPVPPSITAPDGPERTPEIGRPKSLSPGLSVSGHKGESGLEKGDLDTDATVHWGYYDNAPAWGYGPSGRNVRWGFGLVRDWEVPPPYIY